MTPKMPPVQQQAAPPPPPNPPMFGSQAVKKKGTGQTAPQPTMLGGQLAANPTNTGQKTLLGQ